MQLNVSSDASLTFTKEELEELASQLQAGETIVLKFQLEDSWPLHNHVDGHIVDVDKNRYEFRKPILVDTINDFLKDEA